MLTKSHSLRDFIPYYPANWITSYDSIEILTTCNGNKKRAISSSEELSSEQKIIFNTIDQGSDIYINIWYKYQNPLTDSLEKNQIHIKFTVVPFIEAEFDGGNKNMIKYFNSFLIKININFVYSFYDIESSLK